MKKRGLFSALLGFTILLCGCTDIMKYPSFEESISAVSASSADSEAAKQVSTSKKLTLISKGGLGPDGVTTETGYYELALTGTKLQNILYTDFATGTRVFLCNRPECTHRDETCTSVLTGGGYLFPLNGKIGIFKIGSTVPESSDSERRCRVYEMNEDGSERKELCSIPPNISPFSGFATDGDFIYFIAVVISETEDKGESYELLRISLKNGDVTSLKAFKESMPYLGGAFDDKLILEYGTEKDGSYLYQCSVYSITNNEETIFYESATQGFVRGDKVYVIDPQKKVVREASIDGTTQEWSINISIPENSYIDNGGEEFVPSGYIAFTVLIDGTGSRYLLNTQTGELTQSALNYEWYDGSKRPVYVLTAIKDQLLVVNKSELSNMQYLEENGKLSMRESIRTGYAFISIEDYLSGTPNYTPVVDMLSAVFAK